MSLSRRSLLIAPVAAWASAATWSKTVTTVGDSHSVSLQRTAWAGVRIEHAGATLFIDAIAPNPADGQPGPELVAGKGRNFALVTHHHGDHCDPKALQQVLGETGYLVYYEESGRYIDRRIIKSEPTRLYEPVLLSRGEGEFAAFAVPASDGMGSPQVSWVIDCGGKRLIHCGDTLWHGGWWDIARAYGPFDAAFLPINGARQVQGRYTDVGMPIVMSAEQAAAVAQVLGTRLAIPIHYGAPPEPSYFEQPEPEQHFLAAAAARGVHTRVLRPGDSLALA